MKHKDGCMTLPPRIDGKAPGWLPDSRQITIVGGAGAGKSLFMQDMMSLCGERAYPLSAFKASFPEREESVLPCSIDALYREAVRQKRYMRSDAVSELDKLAYMLYVDEFEQLLLLKERYRKGDAPPMKATRLDRLQTIWERLFPGNHVVRSADSLMFETTAGDDLIGISSLSQGEVSVLYYIAAVLYAPRRAVIFIDQPSLFIHPTIVGQLWNALEEMRPDCRFVYDTVDVDFVSSRTENVCVWVKSYDSAGHTWDYDVLPVSGLSDELLVGLVGTRKPVLFIEGDVEHSIDMKLYRLVFTDYNVRPLGSCNKVIETVRSFNDLRQMHHLESHGIVDRDRRTDEEVMYLRRKNIFVPDVAEVENLLLLPAVIRVMSRRCGKDADKVLRQVKQNVMKMFSRHYEEQALQHVRHRVKREVECKIDGRFTCITAMEMHLKSLADKLRPRENYQRLRSEFSALLGAGDYEGVLKVFNHKPMLSDCGVAGYLGFASRDEYIAGVLAALKAEDADSHALRIALKYCFGLGADDAYVRPLPEPESKGEKRRRMAAAAGGDAGVVRREPERQGPDNRKKKRNKANNRKMTRAERAAKREHRAARRSNRSNRSKYGA